MNNPRRPRRTTALAATDWPSYYQAQMGAPPATNPGRTPICDVDPLTLDAPDRAPKAMPDPNDPAVYDASNGLPRCSGQDGDPEPAGQTVRFRR
jgi:hypothetical protein